MNLKRSKEAGPLEQTIERVLAPGRFISYQAAWSFVEDVQAVADILGNLIEKAPERAARLYEIFIGACHEKADEIDDSNGSFGTLVEGLFCRWIKACQSAGVNRDELANSLLTWIEDDPYGFCFHLDREAAKVLDREGLDAFGRCVRAKYDLAVKLGTAERDGSSGYGRNRWIGVLKTVLAAQSNIDAYIELCRERGLGAAECRIVADMYRNRGRLDDALAWVERGLEIARSDAGSSFAEYDLAEMKRALLAKLGRRQEALESAWAEFRKYPSSVSYSVLVGYVPPKEKSAWHGKAMEAPERSDLSSQIELWLEKKEFDRLAARLRKSTDDELESLSHYRSEPAAKKLERSCPELAARLYRASAMRIVKVGKSKYYEAALGNLEHAKKCYMKADLDTEWKALISDVRARHRLKKGFMAGFEQIVSGIPTNRQPTFLERAEQRWPRRGKV